MESLESEETKKRILSVGKKRKHEDDSDNSGDDDVIESEEEDEGRTSIKASKKPLSTVDEIEAVIPVKKAKKKKKSKKERMAEKAEKESQEAIAKPEEENQIPSSKTEEPVQDFAISREPDVVEGRGSAVERKKKRRKVRSKQKNIKKDNRATHEKPEHLRVGSKIYAGRPMTAETRHFKNLPESRTSQIRRDRESKKFEKPKDHDNHLEGGLGIDEFTSDTMNATEEGPDSGEVVNADGTIVETITTDKRSKKKNKKKKSKYKNLK